MTDSEKLDLLLREVTDIKLHLENVTDKNIQIIEENLIDLLRKITEVLKKEKENALLEMRVRILEGEMREVKARLDQTV